MWSLLDLQVLPLRAVPPPERPLKKEPSRLRPGLLGFYAKRNSIHKACLMYSLQFMQTSANHLAILQIGIIWSMPKINWSRGCQLSIVWGRQTELLLRCPVSWERWSVSPISWNFFSVSKPYFHCSNLLVILSVKKLVIRPSETSSVPYGSWINPLEKFEDGQQKFSL